MKRFIRVEATEQEAKAIEIALAQPDVKAFAVIVGTLGKFGRRAQQRIIMNYVTDAVGDDGR